MKQPVQGAKVQIYDDISLLYVRSCSILVFFSSKMGDLKDGFRYGTKEFVERTYKNHRQVVGKSKW